MEGLLHDLLPGLHLDLLRRDAVDQIGNVRRDGRDGELARQVLRRRIYLQEKLMVRFRHHCLRQQQGGDRRPQLRDTTPGVQRVGPWRQWSWFLGG